MRLCPINKTLLTITLLLAAGTTTTLAADPVYSYSGHLKYRSVVTDYPSDSLFQDFIADPGWDNAANMRLNGLVY